MNRNKRDTMVWIVVGVIWFIVVPVALGLVYNWYLTYHFSFSKETIVENYQSEWKTSRDKSLEQTLSDVVNSKKDGAGFVVNFSDKLAPDNLLYDIYLENSWRIFVDGLLCDGKRIDGPPNMMNIVATIEGRDLRVDSGHGELLEKDVPLARLPQKISSLVDNNGVLVNVGDFDDTSGADCGSITGTLSLRQDGDVLLVVKPNRNSFVLIISGMYLLWGGLCLFIKSTFLSFVLKKKKFFLE